MKLRRIKISEITVPEIRVTARMDDETAAQFAESVKAIGVDEPIKVYEVDVAEGVAIASVDGGAPQPVLTSRKRFYLSDGLHRLNQVKAAGEEYIDAIVKPGTYEDVICNNLQSGHLKGKHPVSEMIKSVTYLWKEKGYDSIKIHEKTGLTQDYVEKLQKLSTLTPLILGGLDEGLVNVGQAFELTRLADPIQQESVYHTVKQYRFKGKELEGFIDDVLKLQTPPPPVRGPAPPTGPILVKCEYCGAEGRPGEIANPNTCAACSLAMRQSIAMARAELEAEAKAKKNGEAAAA